MTGLGETSRVHLAMVGRRRSRVGRQAIYVIRPIRRWSFPRWWYGHKRRGRWRPRTGIRLNGIGLETLPTPRGEDVLHSWLVEETKSLTLLSGQAGASSKVQNLELSARNHTEAVEDGQDNNQKEDGAGDQHDAFRAVERAGHDLEASEAT